MKLIFNPTNRSRTEIWLTMCISHNALNIVVQLVFRLSEILIIKLSDHSQQIKGAYRTVTMSTIGRRLETISRQGTCMIVWCVLRNDLNLYYDSLICTTKRSQFLALFFDIFRLTPMRSHSLFISFMSWNLGHDMWCSKHAFVAHVLW